MRAQAEQPKSAEPEVSQSEAVKSDAAEPDAKAPGAEAKQTAQANEDGEANGEHVTDEQADDEAEAKESVEEFRREAQHIRANNANVMGKTEVSGDVFAGNKVITIYSNGTFPKTLTAGQLPTAYRTSVLARFARTSNHDDLVQRLHAHRVLVLRGPRASGRRTAAIGILTDVQQDPRPVRVLDPKTPPGALVEQLRPETGHLIADPSISADDPLRQHHLHAIQEYLQANNSYAIIAIDPRATVEGALEELFEWHPPAAEDILRAHLVVDCPDRSDAQRGLKLEQTRAYLNVQPSPAEIAEYAKTLVAYLSGQGTLQDLANYHVRAAEDHAQRAFADTNDSLREKAFLISLAVFDRLDYPTIAEASDALYIVFEEHETPAEPAGLSIFNTSHGVRLDWARALEYDPDDAGQDLSPARLTAFRNPATWWVLLRHVWLEHPTAREPIRGWLYALGAGASRASRVRAALAAGFLASVDFPSITNALLGRWAGSARLGQRQLAAWALFAAMQQGAEAEVRPVLQRWAEGGVARRWTVVHTVDALADLRDESAIPLISQIAEEPINDPQLRRELVRVAARLLTSAIALEALDTLVEWSQERGLRRDLAHRAFIGSADAQDDGRPKLLGHGTSDQHAWTALVTLWRAALNDASVRDDARRALTGWVLLAADDESLEPELRHLFAELAASANERARLDYLLRHLPPDAPPASLQVAERIRIRLLEQ